MVDSPAMARSSKRNKGSKLLEAYLADREMTISAFAEVVSSTKSYISMLRLGRVTPGLALAAKIEKATEIPCSSWLEPAAKAASAPSS